MAKVNNEKIQAWFAGKSKNYRQGLALYLEFDLEAKLKSKFIIGGETPNNKKVLEAELARLVSVDPSIVMKEREKIAAELLEKQKQAEKTKTGETQDTGTVDAEPKKQLENNKNKKS